MINVLPFTFQIKSLLYSRYYATASNECEVHLRDLASGQHSSAETSKLRQAVGDAGTVSDFTATIAMRVTTDVIERTFPVDC